jgi:aspartate 1-decarboxylase
MSYAVMTPEEAKTFKPTIVRVEEKTNKIKK